MTTTDTTPTRAILRGAILSRADLRGAILSRAELRGAELRGSIHDETTTWPEGFSPIVETVTEYGDE